MVDRNGTVAKSDNISVAKISGDGRWKREKGRRRRRQRDEE